MRLPIQYLQGVKIVYLTASTVRIEPGYCRSDDDSWSIGLDVNTTIDIDVAGANGLQTGQSEATSTWYEVYIIADSSGSNDPCGILVPVGISFSQSGYDKKCLIGYVRNDSSGNFLQFTMYNKGHDRLVIWDESSIGALTDGASATYVDIDCTALAPPSALYLLLGVEFETGASGAASDELSVRPNGQTGGSVSITQGIVSSSKMKAQIELACDSAQLIEYKVTDAANNKASVKVFGYIGNT